MLNVFFYLNENGPNKKKWQRVLDNKLTIHSGEDKTKSILFPKAKGLNKITISYVGHCIK